jgi:hypothetical protein
MSLPMKTEYGKILGSADFTALLAAERSAQAIPGGSARCATVGGRYLFFFFPFVGFFGMTNGED